MLRSFTVFFLQDLQFLYDLWNQKELSILLRSFMKNVKERKERRFFYKERKRMQRMPHSFIKNVKERKECRILL